MKKIVYILTAVIFLFSCSVQKRKYQKGFYVSGKHTKTQIKKSNTVALKKEPEPLFKVSEQVEAVAANQTEVYANAETKIKPTKITRPTILNFSKDEPCDKITLKNGDELDAKVLEVTNFEVKYKKCDMPNGPLYVVKKSDVFMIRYANGTKEIFKTEQKNNTSANTNNNTTNTTNNGPKATHELAILSLVFGILGIVFFFGSIPAIFAGNAALRKIKAHPDKYDGEEMAKIGRILGIIGVILKIFIIVLFVALIMSI